MATIPITMSSAGMVPTPPATILQNLIANVQATNPGYTVLPAGLIEDISSTDVGAIALCDSALSELIASVSPYAANPYILGLLGQVYGVTQGVGFNTSVNVVFSGPIGFVIPQGFVVSDGSYQYATQTTAIIGQSGSSPQVYCLAILPGTWSIQPNTVTQLVTSVPSGTTLTVTNPNAGTPGSGVETTAAYQARVLQAGLAVSQGMTTALRTALQQVSGVTPRLVSIRQPSTGQWEVIVGGGDPYQVANAIFNSLFDISTLVGSTTTSRNVTVNILDYPDTYAITFVVPPQQTVGMTVTWNTISSNYVSTAAIAQAGQPAIVNYINSLVVGQPINLLEVQQVFQNAIANILPSQNLTRLVLSVTVNGVSVSPPAGSQYIQGDVESYFYTTASNISIVQG
ncbi:hypothetical protein WM24_23885 [Burkholderia ubonensis]|uniref:baseplate J/gp47 family protein n=1 Tax=Burkholderia ubonensis TaxID=101571 RepID=UPI00075C170A|nr:baseplate J/gp47 family protein [Burkholderia ubonensis]KWN80878.1 hypothetical protein WM24_23885 [Burkholderia ubonensis]